MTGLNLQRRLESLHNDIKEKDISKRDVFFLYTDIVLTFESKNSRKKKDIKSRGRRCGNNRLLYGMASKIIYLLQVGDDKK